MKSRALDLGTYPELLGGGHYARLASERRFIHGVVEDELNSIGYA
jgi:hypothetical protein